MHAVTSWPRRGSLVCAHWYATEQQVSRTMGQPIYATPTKPFLTNTYLELYVIIGITIFSSTVLFCIFKDVKRRDAIRRTLSGARLCGMDKVA